MLSIFSSCQIEHTNTNLSNLLLDNLENHAVATSTTDFIESTNPHVFWMGDACNIVDLGASNIFLFWWF